MGNVQVCNISNEIFGEVELGNASAKNTASGQSVGRIVFRKGPGVSPGSAVAVTKLEMDKTAQTAKFQWGAPGQNFISVKGTFEFRVERINDKDVPTDSLSDCEITAARINGVDVSPAVDPNA